MKTQLLILASAAVTASVIACAPQDRDPNMTHKKKALVEAGDTTHRPTIDLSQNSDNVAFDFSVRKLLDVNDSKNPPSDENLRRFQAFQQLTSSENLTNVLGDPAEFLKWALSIELQSDSEALAQDPQGTIYPIQAAAFEMPANLQLTNVRFAFTDKDLSSLGDPFLLSVTNPDTNQKIAVQDANGFVLLNKSEFTKLDLDQTLSLKFHESFLALLMKINPALLQKQGKAPVRAFTDAWFSATYKAAMLKTKQINNDQVLALYKKLGLADHRPNYGLIAATTGTAADDSKLCTLESAMNPAGDTLIGWKYVQAGKDVSATFRKDAEFFNELELNLVKSGVCVFKPVACEIKESSLPWRKEPSLSVQAVGKTLPGDTKNQAHAAAILARYRTVQICLPDAKVQN